MITRRMRQKQIRDPDLGSFVSSCACVVKEKQESMVPPSLDCRLVRCTQQCIHFRLFEICDCRSRRPFKGNVAKLPAPLYMLGAMKTNEASQRTDGGQPLVTSSDCAMTS